MDNQIYRPPQAEVRPAAQKGVPVYVRWIVWLPVICMVWLLIGGVYRLCVSIYMMRNQGFVHQPEIWNILFQSVLPQMAVSIILLVFVLRYSRIAAGLLFLWKVSIMGQFIYLLVFRGLPFMPTHFLSSLAGVVLAMVALAGCLLYHVMARSRLGEQPVPSAVPQGKGDVAMTSHE